MNQTLTRPEWTSLREAHEHRAHGLLAEVIARHARGQRHPVEDFMFDYYRLRPGQLVEWHPGVGRACLEADELAARRWYRVSEDGAAEVDVEAVVSARSTTVAFTRELLSATASRPAHFGCFGMHEWAMVYGLEPDRTRHPGLRLRFAPDEIRRIVDEVGLRCSHYDAFRFFTDEAAPRNQRQLTRDDQLRCDQGGCLHVNMDLYKFAGKLLPLVSSELLLDTYQLALAIRELDMRASAYDLRDWGYEPVAVETPAGRADYVRQQRRFAERADELRGRLLGVLEVAAGLIDAEA